MNDKQLISVIIPCYNDGLYLTDAVNSIINQTYKNFEIIIVNDGSTEETTLNILSNLETKAKIFHKENKHLSAARNFGIKKASGEILVLLDADDKFAPTFFEKGIGILNENKNVGVVTSYIKFFGINKRISKPRGGNAFNFLFSNQCPACAMLRKECWEVVGGYDERMKNGYEDWEFYIRLTSKGWIVHVIPQLLFYYRQTKKSMHSNLTIPNRKGIIKYIIEKNKDHYIDSLISLISENKIIFRDSRIAYTLIMEMLSNRLTKKYL